MGSNNMNILLIESTQFAQIEQALNCTPKVRQYGIIDYHKMSKEGVSNATIYKRV